jgi:hypothetical protein
MLTCISGSYLILCILSIPDILLVAHQSSIPPQEDTKKAWYSKGTKVSGGDTIVSFLDSVLPRQVWDAVHPPLFSVRII